MEINDLVAQFEGLEWDDFATVLWELAQRAQATAEQVEGDRAGEAWDRVSEHLRWASQALNELLEDDGEDELEDEDELGEPTLPSEGDYVVSSNVVLTVTVHEGSYIGQFVEDSDAYESIRRHRRETSPEFYPSVWSVSDHGNLSLVNDWSWE